MLDEFIEFKEYTCELTDDFPMRMHKKNVASWNSNGDKKHKGVYAGVPRALKIISRYCIFHTEDMLGSCVSERINPTIHVLKLWCGFEDDNTLFGISDIPELSFVKEWLPTYIHLLLTKEENEKDREKDKCLMEDLRSRCHKNWTRCAFQDSGGANDENSIYFESIIAEAIDAGPLKKQYLVLKIKPTEYATCWGNDYTKICDRGLKTIVAFLINKIPDSQYASIDCAALSNWISQGCAAKQYVTNRVIKEFTYEKKSIFSVDYLDVDNKQNPMLKLSEEWIKDFDPQIVGENNINSIGRDRLVFKDKGCGGPLEEVK